MAVGDQVLSVNDQPLQGVTYEKVRNSTIGL